MSEGRKERHISRRDFTRRAALVAATARCLPHELLKRPATSPGAQGGAPDEKLSPEGQQEVEATIQAIFRKRGDRLSQAQRADIGRLVTEGQKPLEALRTFPLENSDQPGNTLRLYPDVRAARVASH
jgi:hypothetical protein